MWKAIQHSTRATKVLAALAELPIGMTISEARLAARRIRIEMRDVLPPNKGDCLVLILRWAGVVSVAVLLTNGAVLLMDHVFCCLFLGDLPPALDGFFLCPVFADCVAV